MTEPNHLSELRTAGSHSESGKSATVTRSEEELRIYTRRREARRARLRKSVETRMQTVTRTVPLRRERVEIEYEALHDDAGRPDGEPTTGERWLVLYEEEVVIHTRWVARERVRLAVHTVTEDHEITERVRTERLAGSMTPTPRNSRQATSPPRPAPAGADDQP